MVSPKFALQNILNIRHEKVEVMEVELGKLLKILKDSQEFMGTLETTHQDLIFKLGEAQMGEIKLVEMNLLRLNILNLDQEIKELATQIKKQAAAVENKRNQLVEAKQAEETLNILKQKQHEAYLVEQAQIEAQMQDDIYISRAFQNQQGA